MAYKLVKNNRTLTGSIRLVGSKSEGNRVLIIRSLAKRKFSIDNLSEAKDTVVLLEALDIIKRIKYPAETQTIDVGDTGTAMRFLTAFLAIQNGNFILTGSDRMMHRPIGILVDALKKLGADITYSDRKGFPPLLIKGKPLTNNSVEINGSVSSQFISSLLLVAPTLQGGLTLKLNGQLVSQPYLSMTLKIMEHFGVKHSWEENSLFVPQQKYKSKSFSVGADWSAASYWYEMAAFADEVDLFIEGLNGDYLQGDSIASTIFTQFGVITTFEENGIRLTKKQALPESFEFDFADCPDLAQTLAVTCAGLNVPAKLSGLGNLSIKETDRLYALDNELLRLGFKVGIQNNSELIIQKSSKSCRRNYPVKTYDDHRMAMAFAPLAMLSGEITIENPEVVQKSYPEFWNDLQKIGFEIL
ncbi:MAG: 3-phosphoshikimate 1-carboxyvinyltransferase [Bacteroidetes bacterium]|nr:3-phosphoshikimate 1-carboxyvinyltransferase [Bacteroidota bacterium]MBU1719656.1 3-phosphoshikimate 1-carboxyvinyltransferase [Bacteroidota bacterium]